MKIPESLSSLIYMTCPVTVFPIYEQWHHHGVNKILIKSGAIHLSWLTMLCWLSPSWHSLFGMTWLWQGVENRNPKPDAPSPNSPATQPPIYGERRPHWCVSSQCVWSYNLLPQSMVDMSSVKGFQRLLQLAVLKAARSNVENWSRLLSGKVLRRQVEFQQLFEDLFVQ